MADYWKKRLEELNQTTKKTSSSDNYWDTKVKESEASKRTTDIAPVKSTAKTDDRKWFEKGAFEDGYQFGDITKTIGGTLKSAEKSVMSGILGIGEKAVDAGAYAVGAVGGLFSDKFKEKTAEFIAKDLYDERAVAEKIVNGRNPLNMLTKEEDSVLGDKSDSVIESGGQLLGTAALQAVGVPWYLTTGATSFGSEVENAFGQDATYTEAGLSAAITAGAEILTEKISGGISFGGKTLDEGLTRKLALAISNKALRTMTKLGMDVGMEGFEEITSQFFSNLGTSLYREESLSDILFSEEAMDEYLESFIGGAALGGAGGGFNAVNSAVNGVDATSGMTENEEKVFKKVYEDRVAEAGGEKLTTREKNKIYEEVERDMERGYISTDVIEEVLGGESYKAYKDTVDNENALRSEFDALGDTKETELTVKQRERYNELKAKIAEMESSGVRDQFKADLDSEMQRLTEGSRLSESYAERSRRGETFTADLTVYDEKQKAVVQKAIDSGILNNSNRTHEFVDMVAKISADKGVLFDFTNNEKLKTSGFAVDGKSVNGFVTGDGVTVNIDSQKSLNSVVGHEITHVLEGTELYTELSNAVKQYAEAKGEYQGRYETLSALYKDIEGADIDAELTADLVGDYLFTDADFVNNLSVTNRNVFGKIYDEIKYLYKVATAGSKEARELEKVKRAFDKAYKDGGKVADTKYSLSDSDGKQLTKEQSEYFKDSKMRDDNGNLKVMYHGSQDAGFHVFDSSMSDDGTSFFFVDRNDVAASYSGTSETYEAKTIRTAEDMNNFLAEIGYDSYKAIEKDGKFELLENGDHVAWSDTAQGIYEEFCWYEGVGEGDANYKVYLNLTNPLEVDAKGRNWNNISREFSQDVYDRYKSLNAEEKEALVGLAEWGEYSIFRDEMLEARATAEQGGSGVFDEAYTKNLARAYEKLGGANANLYDAFSIAQDNFSEDSLREFAVKQMNTRDYARKAKAEGYDGVIFKNIHDNGGYSNGSEGASTVAIAFDSEQIKSVANEKPTADKDIRYSLSEDSAGRKLSDKQVEYFGNSVVRDDSGKLLAVKHGTNEDFHVFDFSRIGKNGKAEGFGFYFSDDTEITDRYGSIQKEVYLNITKPLSKTKRTITKAKYAKFVNAVVDFDMSKYDDDGMTWRDSFISNYVDTYQQGMTQRMAVQEFVNQVWNFNENDVDLVYEVANGSGKTYSTESMREFYDVLTDTLGYDGIIAEWSHKDGASKVYVTFNSEQSKYVTNTEPTDNVDMRYSLSKDGEAAKEHGRYHIKGKDVALDVAPVQDSVQDSVQDAPVENGRLAWYNRYGERVRDVPVVDDAAPSEPSLEQLRQELSEIEQRAVEVYKSGDVDALTDIGERHTEIANKIAQMEADESARVESLSDADAPPEVDAPYQDDGVTPVDPFAERDIKEVGDRKVKAYMYENPEVKPFFQEEANILLGELRNTTKGERYYTATPDGNANEQYGAESYGVWTGTSRQTTDDIAYLLDTLKYSYAEIEKGLNAIIEDNGKENNAISKRIEFLLNDRLMKGHRDIDGYEIPPNQDYINLLNEKQITEYNEDSFNAYMESIGEFVPGDIAPVAEKYEAIKPKKEPSMKRAENIAPVKDSVKQADTEDAKIAKVMVGEPEAAQKKISGWQKFRTNFLDKNSVFEDLALKTKNRELMGKANFMLSSEARAQHMIGKGTDTAMALNDIRAEVEQTGKTQAFYDYMYHRHNVDRMSMEEKARPVVEGLQSKFGHLRTDQLYAIAAKKITDRTTEKTAQSIREAREYLNAIGAKNKPVFGDSVTADVSREQVSFYEKAHPEFKEYARDVYNYMNHLRGLMVDSGVISQETADLWQEMYPNYVPIRRLGKSGMAVNVPLDTGHTGVNAPIKRAVGGNSDIMDMFDTMAMRTEQTYRAIAKNSFGVELKNTLGTTLEKSKVSVDEVIDSIDAHEELLKKGENGANPTFTVFEDGERVEFEITEEMYDALKPTSDGLKYVNPVANTVSNFHKGVLTEYNPVFSMTNAIKDAQDIIMNSRHPAKTYINVPNALWQMARGGKWYQEYIENGGEQNTYFDGKSGAFKAEDNKLKKVLGLPLRSISFLNNTIERVPRLAEYIASRKNGESVEVSMLDAARVTTNFQAGGDVAKFIDRNGATFLNASIQGFNQQVRNIREAKANGFKGWMQLAAKTAIAGIPALILNDLLWDDDEEYEELSDYVKDNYYIVAKMGDGKFVRIPKGRTLAVIQDAMEQVKNKLTGEDEVDLRNFLDIAMTNLAPNNPIDNNILAPIVQAVTNKAWYGEDIVPTRLQDMPSAEQYDEGTDTISKWLGEKTNTSPMKWNYVLNQYGGGLADMSLPYLTPEAEGGGNKLIAPLTDKFTTDSVMKNQNVSDFYDTVDELTKNANSAKATDEDKLMSKYMNSVNTDLSALYQQKREIQNSGLSDAEKYAAVRDVQRQIDAMTKDALNTYGNVKIDGVYATVGDRHYHVNKEGAWEKVTDKQLEKQNEVTSGLGISPSAYWSNKEEYDFRYEYPEKYDFFRANGITYDDYANADEDGKRAYTWAAENPEKYVVSKAVTGDLFEYRRYTGELYDIKADKDEDGESISGSAKEKKTEYINNLDLDYGQKIILYRSLYDSKADQEAYNQDIVDYLNSREDISYEEMATILKELGFEVDSQGNISW